MPKGKRRGGRKYQILKLRYLLNRTAASNDNNNCLEVGPLDLPEPSQSEPLPFTIESAVYTSREYAVVKIEQDKLPRLPTIRRAFSPRDPRPLYYKLLRAEILHHYYAGATPVGGPIDLTGETPGLTELSLRSH